MRIQRHYIASLLFALSALSFVGIWGLYFFVSVVERQSVLEHIASLLSFSFSEAGGVRWYFVFLTIMPIVFAVLSVLACRESANAWRLPSWAASVALVSTTAVAVLMSWEFALLGGAATYLAVFSRDG
jgi:hypothetical protein